MHQDSQAYRLHSLLNEIAHCCGEQEKHHAARFNLTTAESRCLEAVYLHPCDSIVELAEVLPVVKSRITRILDGLVKKGLIVRGEDESDRRICTVILTPKGARIAEEFVSFVVDLYGRLLSEFDYVEKNGLMNTLEMLDEKMKRFKQSWETRGASIPAAG